MFEWVTSPQAWVGLLTLTVLEIVLGIDNIIFISILSNKLPEHQRELGRKLGLAAALISRLLLLLVIGWVARLTQPVFDVPLGFLAEEARAVSWRDMILIFGGLFLIYKAVKEIHDRLEGDEHGHGAPVAASLGAVITQIMIIDIVFSLDSVITAVGMVREVAVMMIAVIIAVAVMLFAVKSISSFVEAHPTVKMLALAFLVLIGANLVAEGSGQHIPKGYTYFAMGFSVLVEFLNIRAKRKSNPVQLREHYLP